MKLKNLTYIIIALITAITLTLSCQNKIENTLFTGMYDANISFIYKDKNGQFKDTTIKTILIVNKAINFNYAYDIQWILDNYIKINGQTIELKNTIPVIAEKKQQENSLDLTLRCQSSDFKNFSGFMDGNTVIISFDCCNMSISVNSRRFEK